MRAPEGKIPHPNTFESEKYKVDPKLSGRKEEEKPTCPETRESGEFFNYCRKELCGQWDNKHKCCSKVSRAHALWKIKSNLDTIEFALSLIVLLLFVGIL